MKPADGREYPASITGPSCRHTPMTAPGVIRGRTSRPSVRRHGGRQSRAQTNNLRGVAGADNAEATRAESAIGITRS